MLDESKIFYTLIYKGFPKNNDIYDIEENMIFVPDGFGSRYPLLKTSTTLKCSYGTPKTLLKRVSPSSARVGTLAGWDVGN